MDVDVAIEPDLEDPEDETQDAQSEQDLFDANVEAIIDADTPEDTEEFMDEYGEKVDFAEEYLTISNDVAKRNLPQFASTPKRWERSLMKCWATSFSNDGIYSMTISYQASRRCNRRWTITYPPSQRNNSFCPAFFDQDTKLPRPPTKRNTSPGLAMAGEQSIKS